MLMYTHDIFLIIDESNKQRFLDLKLSPFYQDLPRWFGWVSGGNTASRNKYLQKLSFIIGTVRQNIFVNILQCIPFDSDTAFTSYVTRPGGSKPDDRRTQTVTQPRTKYTDRDWR